MKKHHTTFVLLILFFTGLIVYYWADKADVPETGNAHLVLPHLNKGGEKAVQRVEIEKPKTKTKIVFDRRRGNDWQMKVPVDAAANSAMVTTLVKNLHDLRRSSEAGRIQSTDDKYGFNPPAAVVRLYGDDPKTPLAELDVGAAVKGFRDQRYVRTPGPDGGIDVVDSRMVNQPDLPTIAWREKNLFDMPTFYVKAVTVTGPGRDLKLQRGDEHWMIESPLSAPADDEKAEGVAAELASLRVADGEKGYVKDNVTDFAPFGLDKPVMTITLQDRRPKFVPQTQTIEVGNVVPDKPDLRYARHKDQDDVVIVDAKEIAELGKRPNALRSQKVADVNPARTTFLEIASGDRAFKLAQTASEWVLLEPRRDKADAIAVATFLKSLGQLQTSEFLEPGQVKDAGLNPPVMTVKLWQAESDEKLPAEVATAPEGKPHVSLRIGHHDALRKALYGQIEGDTSVLALPETFRDALPKNMLAFRDRTIQTIGPTQFSRVAITRDDATYTLESPDSPGQTLHWRMTEPVTAPADDTEATKIVMILGNLRATELVADGLKDEKKYGLDRPLVTAKWSLRPEASKSNEKEKPPTEGSLRVGNKVPGSENRFATCSASKLVFTLGPEVIAIFMGELRDRTVLKFIPSTVERIVFRWPGRMLSFTPRSRGPAALPEWTPAPGVDPSGFDVSKMNALLNGLSKLQTERYAQYRGSFLESFGLTPPRLSIEFQFEGARPKTLRVGNQAPDGALFATTETGAAGPVFTLAGPAWVELAKAPRRPGDLPDQVFNPPANDKAKP